MNYQEIMGLYLSGMVLSQEGRWEYPEGELQIGFITLVLESDSVENVANIAFYHAEADYPIKFPTIWGRRQNFSAGDGPCNA